MQITQVPSFRTSDGRLFADKREAVEAEARITALSVVNKHAIGKMPSPNTRDVANFLITNADELTDMLKKYRDTIRRSQAGQKAANTRAKA